MAEKVTDLRLREGIEGEKHVTNSINGKLFPGNHFGSLGAGGMRPENEAKHLAASRWER